MNSFYLLAITTILLCLQTRFINAFVVDENGNALINGGSYYIIPVTGGGGLTYDYPECPLHITQEKDITSPGVPVTISMLNRILFILESSAVSFSFKVPNGSCKDKLEWKVVEFDSSIVTDDDEPDYGFSIEELAPGGSVYRIKYSGFQGDDSKDVGFSKKSGLLGSGDVESLHVKFRPAFNVRGLNDVARVVALATSFVY